MDDKMVITPAERAANERLTAGALIVSSLSVAAITLFFWPMW